MSSSGGAWQTASSNRPRNSQSSTRSTPQNRSSTASLSQTGQPSQPPKSNPWTQNRSSTPSGGGVNGPSKAPVGGEEAHQGMNGFNAGEVKAFLGKVGGGAGTTGTYKVVDAAGSAGGRSGGGAWGAKPNTMANGQPFFVQLAKQVATAQGGG